MSVELFVKHPSLPERSLGRFASAEQANRYRQSCNPAKHSGWAGCRFAIRPAGPLRADMTRAQLADLLFRRGSDPVYIPGPDVLVIPQSVERESGSGRSMNLYATCPDTGAKVTVYVRVTD